MKKFEFMNNMTRTFHKVGFQLKKHSPEIMLIAGVAGTVASAVMACKATTKVQEILEETKGEVNQVHAVLADENLRYEEVKQDDGALVKVEKYTEEDSKKDLAIIYFRSGMKFAKLYGPSILLGAVSITSILASHNIMRKRNVALAAAYTAVDKSFKGYRSRVIERFGEQLDKELRYNIKAKEIETVVTDENGEEKIIKETVITAEDTNPNFYSDYAKCFDNGCTGWTKDAELNKMFLRRQQDWANDRLKARGYLFLNEVYESLGIPKTKAGQIVGWVYDAKNPRGDNYVDFGIYNIHNEQARDFVNGYERSIWLDFNVDGNILDLI
jgi:hypothetical protein